MKKISSRNTFFMKKIFPVFWFGFIAVFMALTLHFPAPGQARWVLLIVPCVMTLVGLVIFRQLVWDLMDEVHDAGDFLVVRNRGEEETVRLADIMNVSATTAVNPPRITLRLARPGRFGAEIAFSPTRKFSLNPFAKNEVAEDLMVRVDAARRGGARR